MEAGCMPDVIQISPSLLNAAQALKCEYPGFDGKPFMTAHKFKMQLLGQEKISEAALAGGAVHQAAWGGGEDLPEIGNWIVDPNVTMALNEACNYRKGDGGVPEVPFMMYFPQYKARLSGRCDLLYDYRTVEGKTSASARKGERPDIGKYEVLPQSQAYATFFQVPCEVYLVHLKKSKPRDRKKGTLGLLQLADGPGCPIQKAVVPPTKETAKFLDSWMAFTVDLVSRDEEMLLHLLRKGQREQKGF